MLAHTLLFTVQVISEAFMIFRQLFSEKGKYLGYILSDPITRESLAIDVRPSHLEDAQKFIQARGLYLRFSLQTQWDQEQREAALQLRSLTGARILAEESVSDLAVDMRIRDQDVLYFGEQCLRVLHTPGLSPCAVMYQWEDRIFTGETLLIGGVNRKISGTQRKNIQSRLQALLSPLAGETLLYPAVESHRRRLGSLEELRRRQSRSDDSGFLSRCSRSVPDESVSQNTKAGAARVPNRHQPLVSTSV